MEPGGVAVLAELVRNHIAGAVDVGEAVEKAVPESVVHEVIDPLAVAQVEGEGDVLRLAVEGRRVGDAQLFHMLQAHDARGEGIMKWTTSAQAAAFSKTCLLGTASRIPVAGEQMLHHREELQLPDAYL